MLKCVGNPLAPGPRLATAGPLDKCLPSRTLRRRIAVRISCSSPSSPEERFPIQRVTVDDVQKASPAAEQTQRIGSRGRSSKTTTRAASISSPTFPDFPYGADDGNGKKSQNGAATSRSPKMEVSANGKWQNKHDSSLSEDEPLPLPMTWPGSKPVGKEKVDEMLKCDPETQNCKDVIYQWTGDCKSCQGTGLVSFYRKRHEVISKCITCHGIGSVHKITSRADIQDMDGSKGNFNGSARGTPGTGGPNGSIRGSPGTNGKS